MSEQDESFEKGVEIRRQMWGDKANEMRIPHASDFTQPFETQVTRYCFGETWARPGLDPRTRSMITLAALAALVRPNQLRVHVRGAIQNGVTREEIQEILMHTAVYAGIPAGVEAFSAASEVLKQME